MTQKTKLEIIGPYTPEHEGPYAIDAATSAEVLHVKANVHCVFDGIAFITTEHVDGPWLTELSNLMNAREVPVAREFWLNEYEESVGGGVWFNVFSDASTAKRHKADTYIRTIHLREVLPGEGA